MSSYQGKTGGNPGGDSSQKKKESLDPSKTAPKSGDTSKKDDKKKENQLRPTTPPAQTGSRFHDDDGNSPCSQACESGTVTPNSEGVWRKDRKKFHLPPGGLGP